MIGGFRSPGSGPKQGGRQTPHVMTGREEKVSAVLDGVAKRHNRPITAVALAYAMQKVSHPKSRLNASNHANILPQSPYIFPMVGGNKVSQLKANVEALSLELTPEDIAEIDKGYDFDLGFPHNFINMAGYAPQGPQDVSFLSGMGYFDNVAPPAAIKPHKG